MKAGEVILRRKINKLLYFFIAALVLSGITAFPIEWELSILQRWSLGFLEPGNPIGLWINKVREGLHETYRKYPFVAYGTDWLGFAHLVIAIAFIGPLKDPIKNIWVIEFGLISCILIFPMAIIGGEIRDIPFFWRFIDCAFGALGIIPLLICRRYIKRLSDDINYKGPSLSYYCK